MNDIQKNIGTFAYGHRKISFNYWSNAKNDAPPDVAIFLGAGQVGKIPYWVTKSSGSGVVVIEGLPSWESDTSEQEVKSFSKQYVQNAFATILRHFNLESIHVIAESQAAPGVLHMTTTMSRSVRNLALIRPLGFTVKAYGGTVEARLKSFRQRLRRAALLQFPQAFLHDPLNLTVSVIARRAAKKDSAEAFAQKFGVGISHDATRVCRIAANKLQKQGSTFTVLLGEKDILFPPSEVLATLDAANVTHVTPLVVPKSPHSSLATRTSKVILHQALQIVRAT